MHRTTYCSTHDTNSLLVEDVSRLSFDGHRLSCGCFLFWDADDNHPEVRIAEEVDEMDAEYEHLLTLIFSTMGAA